MMHHVTSNTNKRNGGALSTKFFISSTFLAIVVTLICTAAAVGATVTGIPNTYSPPLLVLALLCIHHNKRYHTSSHVVEMIFVREETKKERERVSVF